MPRLIRKLPSYRLHKGTGQAVVTIDGRDRYLGKFGTPESRAEYDRIMAEWLASRRLTRPAEAPSGGTPLSDLTVDEVLLAFWRHAERHYPSTGDKKSGELANFRDTIQPFRAMFGPTIAREFSPLKLKALRQTMIASGLARTTINQRVRRIVHIFKWAASEVLVPVSVHQALKTVSGLQKGRSDAKETKPVKPVSEASVDAIRPYVTRQVWAMVELQRLTGMRPGEVTGMRACDLDTSGRVWFYTPESHKTEHHGKGRTIYLGPRAQEVLRPWLRTELTAYLFQPREAMAEFRIEQRRNRTTPLYPSTLARARKSNPKRSPGARYSTRTYYHSIRNGCKKAGIPPWHPHQLRHNAGTWLRKEFGLEVARVILGHSSPAVTEVYAEMDRQKALAVMEQVG